MYIQIRENIENDINIQHKKIDCRLSEIDDNISKEHNVWSFNVVSSPIGSDVFHSSDGPQDLYLNYGAEDDIEMEIKLSVEGVYVIKVLCKNSVATAVDRIKSYLDADGVLHEETVEDILLETNITESSEMELEYRIPKKENAWT